MLTRLKCNILLKHLQYIKLSLAYNKNWYEEWTECECENWKNQRNVGCSLFVLWNSVLTKITSGLSYTCFYSYWKLYAYGIGTSRDSDTKLDIILSGLGHNYCRNFRTSIKSDVMHDCIVPSRVQRCVHTYFATLYSATITIFMRLKISTSRNYFVTSS